MSKQQTLSASARLVYCVEQVLNGRGSIGDNFSDQGNEAILVQLRVAMRHAPAIALTGDKFNFADDLIAETAASMVRAHSAASGHPVETGSDEGLEESEAYYLLGLLVGVELASGVGGTR